MIARMAAEVAVWMGLAGVLAGLLAWRVQKGFDDNRKAELDTWCAGRARPLQQQFISTSDHFKVADGRHAVDRRPSGTCSTTSRRKAPPVTPSPSATITLPPAPGCTPLPTEPLLTALTGAPPPPPPALKPAAAAAFTLAFTLPSPSSHAPPLASRVPSLAPVPRSHLSPTLAVFERRMGCTPGDMQERPAPPADWYMDMRFWFDEQGPFPLVENSTTCSDGHLHPSYGPELTRMKITGAAILTTPYFLNNGHPGMAMMFPIFKGNVTAAAPWAERQAVIMGGMAVSVDFDRLAESIILEVLRQAIPLPPHNPTAHNPTAHNPTAHNPTAHNPTAHNPTAHNPPAQNPLAHNPPAHNPPAHNPPTHNPPAHNPPAHNPPAHNPPHNYQSITELPALAVPGSDEAHSMTAVFLGVIILVVAALLAAIGVSVTINMRRLREKTISMAILKEKAEVAERNKGAHIANTSPTHRLSCAPQSLAWKVRGNKVHG
ncbi:unnamed protein product [Closterium sp. Naga37s-1]|nr:unnamed protein product [Closterium sp. Naga37s-1]